MRSPFLVGERVYLRPLEEEDLDRCQRWINDPEVRRFLSHYRPVARSGELEWLRSLGGRADELVLAIALKVDDRHIGNCGLHRIDWREGTAELGILIGEPDCRGKGYGPEAMTLLLDYAFGELRLHRVGLRVFSYNAMAIRAYEKVGFKLEGCLRKAHFHGGRHHDVLLYGILASEWELQRR